MSKCLLTLDAGWSKGLKQQPTWHFSWNTFLPPCFSLKEVCRIISMLRWEASLDVLPFERGDAPLWHIKRAAL